MAPINEYLLLLAHPASRIPTIPMDDTAIRKKIPTLKFREGNTTKSQYRRDNHDERGKIEQESVDVVDVDDLLG